MEKRSFITGEIRELMKVGFTHFRPMLSNIALHLLGHLEFIHSQAPLVISALALLEEQLRSEQSINLLDAAFMRPIGFHRFEQ